MSVDVAMISATKCNTSYETYFDVGMICAGNFEEGGIDSCSVLCFINSVTKVYFILIEIVGRFWWTTRL